MSVNDFAAFWAKIDGCDAKPVITDLPPITNDGTSVSRAEYQHCKGAPVVFYAIKGGGHAWPSGTEHIRLLNIGTKSMQINATDVIWQFFKSLPK